MRKAVTIELHSNLTQIIENLTCALNLGTTQVCKLSFLNVFLSRINERLETQVKMTKPMVIGHINHIYHLDLEVCGWEAREANPNLR